MKQQLHPANPVGRGMPIISSIAFSVFFLLVIITGPAPAQVPQTEFKEGAYRGTLQVTITMPDVATTKTVLKIAGRTQGASVLRFLAPPQPGQPLIVNSDDNPIKLFYLSYSSNQASMTLTELLNTDSSGSVASLVLNSLTVRGNVVTAETTQTLSFGSPITITLRIRLVRVSA
jgi:hypothetical protein